MPSNTSGSGQEATDNVAFLPGVREADEKRAENVSLHALGRRGMSRAEVVDLLTRREIDPIVVHTEVERLERVGLIDDEALATTLVDQLVDRKKFGPTALRAELMRRRIDPRAIESALALQAPDDEGALIAGLVGDRMRRIGILDRETAERRLLSHLARKGHGGSAARDAVRVALDEAGLERAPRTSGFGSRSGGGSGGFGSQGSGSGRAAAGDGPRRVEFE